MALAAAGLKEIYNVLKVYGISERVSYKRLIDNEGFNSLKDFVVMDREMYML